MSCYCSKPGRLHLAEAVQFSAGSEKAAAECSVMRPSASTRRSGTANQRRLQVLPARHSQIPYITHILLTQAAVTAAAVLLVPVLQKLKERKTHCINQAISGRIRTQNPKGLNINQRQAAQRNDMQAQQLHGQKARPTVAPRHGGPRHYNNLPVLPQPHWQCLLIVTDRPWAPCNALWALMYWTHRSRCQQAAHLSSTSLTISWFSLDQRISG